MAKITTKKEAKRIASKALRRVSSKKEVGTKNVKRIAKVVLKYKDLSRNTLKEIAKSAVKRENKKAKIKNKKAKKCKS